MDELGTLYVLSIHEAVSNNNPFKLTVFDLNKI